jgi:hypothetical protein
MIQIDLTSYNESLFIQITLKQNVTESKECELHFKKCITSNTFFLLDLSFDAISIIAPLRSTVNSGLDWLLPNFILEKGENLYVIFMHICVFKRIKTKLH